MNVRAIKTVETKSAVNRIKNMTNHRFDLGVSLSVPKEFIEKRNYMQSDEFLKDEHNLKMFDYTDAMMSARDKIAAEIKEANKHISEKLVQAINGFKRNVKDIEKNPELHFDETPSYETMADNDYRVLKNILIYSESLNAKN